MTPTIERSELPTKTYQVLETKAQEQGFDPDEYLNLMLYREGIREKLLEQLEQEYQELTDKDLAHILTEDEGKRLETVQVRLNLMEELSDDYRKREQRAAEIDAKFAELERRVDALGGC